MKLVIDNESSEPELRLRLVKMEGGITVQAIMGDAHVNLVSFSPVLLGGKLQMRRYAFAAGDKGSGPSEYILSDGSPQRRILDITDGKH